MDHGMQLAGAAHRHWAKSIGHAIAIYMKSLTDQDIPIYVFLLARFGCGGGGAVGSSIATIRSQVVRHRRY